LYGNQVLQSVIGVSSNYLSIVIHELVLSSAIFFMRITIFRPRPSRISRDILDASAQYVLIRPPCDPSYYITI
jgi:hypothetical protein